MQCQIIMSPLDFQNLKSVLVVRKEQKVVEKRGVCTQLPGGVVTGFCSQKTMTIGREFHQVWIFSSTWMISIRVKENSLVYACIYNFKAMVWDLVNKNFTSLGILKKTN